ncbi:MAG: SdrD B-like domain-containing protein, partial [Saprospiraceae bacterium]|nr:SdrD B-like domain-containing protein [Saprospiraceae bacterium]
MKKITTFLHVAAHSLLRFIAACVAAIRAFAERFSRPAKPVSDRGNMADRIRPVILKIRQKPVFRRLGRQMLRIIPDTGSPALAMVWTILVMCSTTVLMAGPAKPVLNGGPEKEKAACSLTITNVSVGECRNDATTGNQPKVLVAVFLEWTMAPAGADIEVTVDGQTETIDPSVDGCSPYVQFIVDADGVQRDVQAEFTSGGCVATPIFFDVPAACLGNPACSGPNAVGGTVYRDFDSDGTKDASEFGVEGALIHVYDASENLLCTSTSDFRGRWTCLGLTAGQKVRVEIISYPFGLNPGGLGPDNFGGVVQFATVGSNCTVDFGLLPPETYCENDPIVVTPCYITGDPLKPGDAATAPVLVAVSYDPNAQTGDNNGNTPVNRYIANGGEVGTVWGIAHQRSTKKVFSSALLKRHAGWGPGGLGAIYVTDVSNLPPVNTPTSGLTSLYINLDNYGIITGNEGSLTRDLSGDPSQPSYDTDVFDLVGKWGLGDIDISSDEDSLFAINLFNKSLVTIAIGNPAVFPVPSNNVSEVLIPNPNCSNTSDWRPFALKYYKGKLYIGGVCSAQSSQNTDDLHAVIYEYDFVTQTFTIILEFPIDYSKGIVLNGLSHCEDWNPWTDDFNDFPAGGIELCYPQPLLSDIEFDVYGNMMIAFNDRGGHQIGWYNYGTTPPSTKVWKGNSGGDVLRVINNGGEWLIERNGTAGYDTGCGDGNGQGPCGGEFYCQDSYLSAHQEAVHGGIAIHPSNNELLLNMMDATSAFSGGLAWYNNATGVKNDAYRVYFSGNSGNTGLFGKAAGLGDVELLCSNQPVEIGNFVWVDTDKDGIQDPDEAPLVGVRVTLYQGNSIVKSVFTDGSGQFKFDQNDGVLPNTQYCIVFGTNGQFANGQLTVNSKIYKLTSANTGFGPNTDQNDSDASIGVGPVAGLPAVCLTTGSLGQNNNTFDAGFVPAVDFGDLPDTDAAGSYPTNLNDGASEGVGASHEITTKLKIGAVVDAENDGQPNANANGDDTAGTPDDEDGVTLPTFVLNRSYMITVQVMNTTGSTAKLTGYFDWNNNGTLNDLGEVFSVNVNNNGTSGTLNVSVPANAATNTPIGVRFRLSTNAMASMSPTGPAPDGEVEDYITEVLSIDFGDLPDNDMAGSYPTNTTNGAGEGVGPSHRIITGLKIGPSVDSELDGQPSTMANGDDNNGDDEDGIPTFPVFSLGQTAVINISVMNMTTENAILVGFFDWNKDRDFNDPLESASVTIPAGTNGIVQMNVPVPNNAVTNMDLGARFRLSTGFFAASVPVGPALDGEVEDYLIKVACPVLDIAADVNQISCFGANDGAIALTVNTGTAPFNYDWADIAGTNNSKNRSNLSPNTYTVTVTDANGCTGVLSRTITQPADLTATAMVTDVTCVGLSNGAINLTPSGGTQPYTYDWNNDGPENPDDDGADLVNIPTGTYTVTITDANGCTETLSRFVDEPPIQLTLDLKVTQQAACGGSNGAINLTVTGSNPPFTYDWSNDGPDDPDNDSEDLSNIPAGLYFVTVTDNNGCTQEGFITVGNEPGPEITSVVVVDADCFGAATGSIDITVTGGTSPLTYDWSNDGPESPDNDAQDLIGVAAGTYSVTVTDINGCQAMAMGIVEQPTILRIALTIENEGLCGDNGGSLTAFVSGGTGPYTYDWSNDGPDSPDNDNPTISGLAAGPYSVTVTDANGCQMIANANITCVQPASIGNYVWEDLNWNGIQEGNEPPIPNVAIILEGTDVNGNDVNLTTATDGNGNYLFDNLWPGDYKLTFITPSGFIPTNPNDSDTNDALDSDAVPNLGGMTATETLVAGEYNPNYDAGYYRPASIGNYVWEDNDADGEQDPGEPGIQGVKVVLTGTTGQGTSVMQMTFTDVNGEYGFTNLVPGDYKLTFTTPDAMVTTPLNQAGGDDTQDSDANPAMGGMTATETLISGENNPTYDAGYYAPVAVGDYVWLDENANGVQDAGEPGIQNVEVKLLNGAGNPVTVDAFGNAISNKFTTVDGYYLFNNLVPGVYKVMFINPNPSKYTLTIKDAGTDDAQDSDANQAMLMSDPTDFLNSGEEDLTLDAGFFVKAKVGDFVWEDKNGNGVQDNGEPGINGATVTLTGTDNQGNAVNRTVVTSGNGMYMFGDLVPGEYKITFTTPTSDNYTTTPANEGNDDGKDSDADPANMGMTPPFTVESGDTIPTFDAGYYVPAKLGDTVWVDINANGIQDLGEPGLGNVNVILTGTDGTGNPVNLTTTTDATGMYMFGNLQPGDYKLTFETPTGGYQLTGSDQGGNDADDSDAYPFMAGMTDIYTVESGDTIPTIDAGYYLYASIGNYVWLDQDADGEQDPNEPGIQGVKVTLTGTDGLGNNVMEMTTTDINGEYLFDELVPGNYKL